MPQSPERKREYNRARQRQLRQTNESSDAGGEHYWLRKAGEDFAVCTEFEFQGRLIGGCGEKRKYEGKLLSTRLDGGPDLGIAIADSPHYKEVQQKMPVTKGRNQ